MNLETHPIGTAERLKLLDELRPEVIAFAQLMERELRANESKGGWKDDGPTALAKRVEEESGELSRAVNDLERQIVWADEPTYGSRGGNGWSRLHNGVRQVGIGYRPLAGDEREAQLAKIASEAADVANMAMMVADVCGQLEPVPATKAAA